MKRKNEKTTKTTARKTSGKIVKSKASKPKKTSAKKPRLAKLPTVGSKSKIHGGEVKKTHIKDHQRTSNIIPDVRHKQPLLSMKPDGGLSTVHAKILAVLAHLRENVPVGVAHSKAENANTRDAWRDIEKSGIAEVVDRTPQRVFSLTAAGKKELPPSVSAAACNLLAKTIRHAWRDAQSKK